ncbi:cytochrome P450 [Sphingomonas sanxanigenens]|nr:cytochrome P450 [Sphingomonas sanxanigenens]
MMDATLVHGRCPAANDDDRKSAAIAADGLTKTHRTIAGYEAVRAVLRDDGARQAGFMAELLERFGGAMRPPILFLEGAAHRRQRSATARFFAPKLVGTRHRAVMVDASDRLVAAFRRDGAGDLDALSLDLAVTVAGEIVGLTDSDRGGMIRRLDAFLSVSGGGGGGVTAFVNFVLGQWRMMRFHRADVLPAIRARRAQRQDDVISHLIDEGYSEREILTECVTYGAAGMVTTREFVTMAGWHMLEQPALRDRFLDADETGQIALLEEILRLEPVVGTLYRRISGEPAATALDIRAANADATAMGACPHRIDPARDRAPRVPGAGLAFGDGAHRCPGAGVAMLESALFLDRLLRVPGLRLERPPTMRWNALVTGYELRGCRISC